MKFTAINPYTAKQLSAFPLISDADLQQVVAQAEQAFHLWKQQSFQNRGKLMMNLSALMQQESEKLSRLAAEEMGKPIKEARHEIQKCLTAFSYYADNAAQFLKPLHTNLPDGREVVQQYEPYGIILGVFPWNFPYWQIIRSAVPVVMAGNTILIKPAPNVPQCALALQALFTQAGFPTGVLQTIFAEENQVAQLISDKRIKACTLTGSEKAGAAVASAAAAQIKKSVLELGGSDPFLVFPDANLEEAVKVAITSRFQNNGQSCIGAKRFIVHHEVADVFLNMLIAAIKQLPIGNPIDEQTAIGPLARKDLRDKLAVQVNESVIKGAHIAWQEKDLPQQGFFYPPTILTDIKEGMPAFDEELFGPVIAYYACNNEDEMLRIANETQFGLGASVWTTNDLKAMHVANSLQAGQVFVNGLVRSDVRFPFGGIKKSGYGRELGELGMKEFTYIKTIWRQ
ncbi:MAG: NAD-dependent succinate-semialdehyde dehydrogenase [Bacteroidota bacterium]|jgi:succinate-semialdehyde dehydrogenase/glutarate-semialdehyde dehydrogenase